MGRHSAGESDESDESGITPGGASPPSSPARRRWTLRRKVLAVLGGITAAIVILAAENAVVGVKTGTRPSSDVVAAPTELNAPVGVTSTVAARLPSPSPSPSPSPRKTTAPPAPPVTHAAVQQPQVAGSGLAPLGVDTQLTGSAAVAWGEAALAALGAPATSANIKTMVDWFNNEGIPHDYNNPLNLNVAYGGSTVSTADGDPPSDGIQAFPTPADFAAAFPLEMNNGSFSAMAAALKAGIGLEGSAASSEIASELYVYSGSGYDSIPRAGQ
jgi:hypothetical protein